MVDPTQMTEEELDEALRVLREERTRRDALVAREICLHDFSYMDPRRGPLCGRCGAVYRTLTEEQISEFRGRLIARLRKVRVRTR